jgi:hypothetical protein
MNRFERIAAANLLLWAAFLMPASAGGRQQNAHSSTDDMASVGAHADELDKNGICADKKLHDYSGWCAATAFPLKVKIVAFAVQPQTTNTGLQCHPNGRCDMRSMTLSSGQMVMTCLTSTPSCPSDTVFVLQAPCGTRTVPFYSRTKCAPLLTPEEYRARGAVSGPGFEILLHTPDNHGLLHFYTYRTVGEENVE